MRYRGPKRRHPVKSTIILVFLLCELFLARPFHAQTLKEVFTEEDRLLYRGYEVIKCYDSPGDFWFAILKKEGKVLATFKRGYNRKEWTDFGLFSFLGGDKKQLIVEQFSGGAHCCWSYWILELSPDLEVIYESQQYPVGYDLVPVDLDEDGVFEFTQGILTFDYFDRLCHALSPIPTVVFQYDEDRKKYSPASHLFPEYLLNGIEKDILKVKELNERTDFATYDDSGGEYLSAVLQVVLRYIYAGKENEAWSFYESEYHLPDKEEMKSKIKKKLKNCLVYKQIYQAQKTSILKLEPTDLSDVKTEKLNFTEYYSLTPLDITLRVPPYNLPLPIDEISNFSDFSSKIPLSSEALRLLEKNGFVVIDNPFNPREEYITRPYETLKDREIPIFITSDSLLHLHHIQFDETLRQIEEKDFYEKLWQISQELLDDSIENYQSTTGDLKEAAKRNAAYFAVGLSLLQPRKDQLCRNGRKCEDPGLASAYFQEEELAKYQFKIPNFVKDKVGMELELIEKHEGFSQSPLFVYREDYSQYIPRGHYTRSEKLKNYFKSFMWYGRMSMLLKGNEAILLGKTDPFNPEALISKYDAKVQTIQALLIASKLTQSKELIDRWERIYSVTSFYVGLADDLGPYEYLEVLNSVFNSKFHLDDLTEENIGKIKAKLAEYMPPKIFGGTGDCGITPPFTPEEADECLEKTKGFRLMGQRFIPDSYIFSNLVGSYTGLYLGDRDSRPFTLVMSAAGPIRGFPRGLDLMALLGSKRAKMILKELGDSHYQKYSEASKRLEDEFSKLAQRDWNKNLYWAWLDALRSLLKELGDGYPTFMKTSAWQDKELTTALASWAELRHDTILYAKQSYTVPVAAAPGPRPPEKPVVGYIEPVPEFYNHLLALTKMTTRGLNEMEVLDEASKSRLESLERILEKLVDLSVKELKNEELEKEDYEFIKNFGKWLNAAITEIDEKAKRTTIIADVHTDSNTEQVLEEGIGYVNLTVVAYRVPDGRILMGAGPVMTYYEFKQPMKDRLTDERWRKLLASKPPEEPEWASNFIE
jgi:hypothetical protein